MHLLRKLGKGGLIVNESNLPVECRGLPGVQEIKQFPCKPEGDGAASNSRSHKPEGDGAASDSRSHKVNGFDCGVYLDSGEASRVGKVHSILSQAKRTLNIDHHFSNKRFAGVNWVDPSASCTCEMICRLYRYFKIDMDKDTALALYAGIIADTGSFHYSNTAVSTHQIAAQLLKKAYPRPRLTICFLKIIL